MKKTLTISLFFLLFFSILNATQFEKSSLNYSFSIGKIKTKIYDFSQNASIDRWAYRKNARRLPASYGRPNREFNDRQYSRISSNDDVYQEDTARDKRYAAHRFVFTIHENKNNITSLSIFWKGAGIYSLYLLGIENNLSSGSGFKLFAWNYSSNSYDEIFNTTSYNVFSVSKNISLDYIDNNTGNLTLLVEQNSQSRSIIQGLLEYHSTIKTDYVYAEVKYV